MFFRRKTSERKNTNFASQKQRKNHIEKYTKMKDNKNKKHFFDFDKNFPFFSDNFAK